jgi:hypothetical protein
MRLGSSLPAPGYLGIAIYMTKCWHKHSQVDYLHFHCSWDRLYKSLSL